MNTDWLDERIRLGEVPPASQDRARARLDTEEGRLAQDGIAISDASILERLPPDRVAKRIRQRVEERRTGFRMVSWSSRGTAFAFAASIALCAVFAPRVADRVFSPDAAVAGAAQATPATTNPSDPDATEPGTPRIPAADPRTGPGIVAAVDLPDDGIRLRGDGDMALFVVAPDGATTPCGPGVEAGATLRVVVPRSAQAAVWSIDETGSITRHWPIDGDSSSALAAGPLPRDWETDPSTGWERFVLVESPAKFELKAAEAHLRGLVASSRPRDGRILLPGRLQAHSIVVERNRR